jgi:hypothetical protein
MRYVEQSRRKFLSSAAVVAGISLVHGRTGFASLLEGDQQSETKADYSLKIATQPIELARTESSP